MISEKNRYFWEYAIFPSSNPQKPPFLLKLELMRMSKILTATKKIKITKVGLTSKIFFSRFFRDFSKNIFQDEHFSLKIQEKTDVFGKSKIFNFSKFSKFPIFQKLKKQLNFQNFKF